MGSEFERSFEVMVAQLQGEDESLRDWAERGLRLLSTKEARRVLWSVLRALRRSFTPTGDRDVIRRAGQRSGVLLKR